MIIPKADPFVEAEDNNRRESLQLLCCSRTVVFCKKFDEVLRVEPNILFVFEAGAQADFFKL